jgi:hypothetical protein
MFLICHNDHEKQQLETFLILAVDTIQTEILKVLSPSVHVPPKYICKTYIKLIGEVQILGLEMAVPDPPQFYLECFISSIIVLNVFLNDDKNYQSKAY